MDIIVDLDILKQNCSNMGKEFNYYFLFDNYEFMAENPYYQLRGKPITPEQADEIITKTDKIFENVRTSITSKHICNSLFKEKDGWVLPDGTICQNSYIKESFPKLKSLLDEIIEYVKVFPFLEFIIAITWYDKNIYGDFFESVDAGIWVHDNKIEFINAQETIEVYKDFEAKYDYNFNPDIIDVDYLKKCLTMCNIKNTDYFLDKYFNGG